MSLLINPARGDESAIGRSECGGPKTWKTTVRASARNASPTTKLSSANGSLRSVRAYE